MNQAENPENVNSSYSSPKKWKIEKKEEKQYFKKYEDTGLIEYVQNAVPGVKEISAEKYNKFVTDHDLNSDLPKETTKRE